MEGGHLRAYWEEAFAWTTLPFFAKKMPKFIRVGFLSKRARRASPSRLTQCYDPKPKNTVVDAIVAWLCRLEQQKIHKSKIIEP
jgi:hypothetical protein